MGWRLEKQQSRKVFFVEWDTKLLTILEATEFQWLKIPCRILLNTDDAKNNYQYLLLHLIICYLSYIPVPDPVKIPCYRTHIIVKYFIPTLLHYNFQPQ